MSVNITTAFVRQFVSGITHLAEQKMSRLRRGVRVETLASGDRAFFDQIGSVTATRLTQRHADTPLTDTPHSRRVVIPNRFVHADLVDRADQIRVLNDPTNAYTVAFARAFGRAIDDEIITAATGTAYTGVAGGTSEAWSSLSGTWQVGTGSAMTLAKIIQANKMLREAENDPEDGFFFAVSQEQLEDMLNDSTITSGDYNSVRALMTGTITQFMGFDWIPSERLDTVSSERRCLAWAKMALLLGVAEEPQGRISERSDKNYSTQVYYEADFGATRMVTNGIVAVLCSE